MFAVESPVISLRARLSGRISRARTMAAACRSDEMRNEDPQLVICDALAEMLPATAGEIAEAAGLDTATTAACLERLSARCQVMFNPLTKRFSLPKGKLPAGIAA